MKNVIPYGICIVISFPCDFWIRSNHIWTVFSLPFKLRFSWNFLRILPRDGENRILNCILLTLYAFFRKVTLLSDRLGVLPSLHQLRQLLIFQTGQKYSFKKKSSLRSDRLELWLSVCHFTYLTNYWYVICLLCCLWFLSMLWLNFYYTVHIVVCLSLFHST